MKPEELCSGKYRKAILHAGVLPLPFRRQYSVIILVIPKSSNNLFLGKAYSKKATLMSGFYLKLAE